MIDYILVKRLAEFVSFPFYWDNVEIREEDLTELESVDEVTTPFSDSPVKRLIEGIKPKEWHLGRIKFFINNPEKISPIDIDNVCTKWGIIGLPIIVDGNHRFLASLIRGDHTIPAYYSGLISTLDYLTGQTNIKPVFL